MEHKCKIWRSEVSPSGENECSGLDRPRRKGCQRAPKREPTDIEKTRNKSPPCGASRSLVLFHCTARCVLLWQKEGTRARVCQIQKLKTTKFGETSGYRKTMRDQNPGAGTGRETGWMKPVGPPTRSISYNRSYKCAKKQKDKMHYDVNSSTVLAAVEPPSSSRLCGNLPGCLHKLLKLSTWYVVNWLCS